MPDASRLKLGVLLWILATSMHSLMPSCGKPGALHGRWLVLWTARGRFCPPLWAASRDLSCCQLVPNSHNQRQLKRQDCRSALSKWTSPRGAPSAKISCAPGLPLWPSECSRRCHFLHAYSGIIYCLDWLHGLCYCYGQHHRLIFWLPGPGSSQLPLLSADCRPLVRFDHGSPKKFDSEEHY